MFRLAKAYIVCTKCMRVFNRKRLLETRGKLECPYCGNTRFSESFGNVILVLDPERSAIAKKLNKTERGIFALSLE